MRKKAIERNIDTDKSTDIQDSKNHRGRTTEKKLSKPESPFVYKSTKAIARQILKVLVRSLAKDIESQKKLVNGAIKLLRADDMFSKNIQSNPHMIDNKTTKLALRFLNYVASGPESGYSKWANGFLRDIREALGQHSTKRATGISKLPVLNPKRDKKGTPDPLLHFWKMRARELKEEFRIEKYLRELEGLSGYYANGKKKPNVKLSDSELKERMLYAGYYINHGIGIEPRPSKTDELKMEMGSKDLLVLVGKFKKKVKSIKEKEKPWEQHRSVINELFQNLFKKPCPEYLIELLRNPRCSATHIAIAFVSSRHNVPYEKLRSLYFGRDYSDLRKFLSLSKIFLPENQ